MPGQRIRPLVDQQDARRRGQPQRRKRRRKAPPGNHDLGCLFCHNPWISRSLVMAGVAFTVATMTDENRSAPPLSSKRSASLMLDASELPRRRGWGRQAMALIGLALAAKLADQAGLNSRTLLDPYSLLHLVFGAVLFKLVRWKRPDWPLWTLLAAVIVSSTIWEVAENLPLSIGLFGYSSGDPLAYHGDSIVNSFSDTAAATLGAVLALPLAGWVVAVGGAAVELGLSPHRAMRAATPGWSWVRGSASIGTPAARHSSAVFRPAWVTHRSARARTACCGTKARTQSAGIARA